MPSTVELVRAAQAGETSAFAELVRRYERAATITAYTILGDFHASQDAVQEAFVSAYWKLNQLRDAASFGAWLLQITRRGALRLKREQHTKPAAFEGLDYVAAQTQDWIEPYADVVEQLARLPEHERIVLIMRYMDGQSIRDIAESTGAPVGTITKQLSRAIRRLRDWFVEVQS